VRNPEVPKSGADPHCWSGEDTWQQIPWSRDSTLWGNCGVVLQKALKPEVAEEILAVGARGTCQQI
jgi:hypothetical protein